MRHWGLTWTLSPAGSSSIYKYFFVNNISCFYVTSQWEDGRPSWGAKLGVSIELWASVWEFIEGCQSVRSKNSSAFRSIAMRLSEADIRRNHLFGVLTWERMRVCVFRTTGFLKKAPALTVPKGGDRLLLPRATTLSINPPLSPVPCYPIMDDACHQDQRNIPKDPSGAALSLPALLDFCCLKHNK